MQHTSLPVGERPSSAIVGHVNYSNRSLSSCKDWAETPTVASLPSTTCHDVEPVDSPRNGQDSWKVSKGVRDIGERGCDVHQRSEIWRDEEAHRGVSLLLVIAIIVAPLSP